MAITRILTVAMLIMLISSQKAAFCGDFTIGDAGPADIPVLVDILQAGGSDSYYAGEVLAGFGEEAVPPLLKALDSGRNTYGVIVALGMTKDKRALSRLTGYLCGDDAGLAEAAAGALRNYGDAAFGGLVGGLKVEGCFERSLDVLRYISPSKDSLDAMRGLAKSADQRERAAAGELLGWWKDYGSEDIIRSLLSDKEPLVRRKAVTGYELMHNEEPGKYDSGLLIGLLDDEDPFVRGRAALLLVNFPSDETTTALIARVNNDEDQAVRAAAVTGLESAKDPRIAFELIKVLQEDDPNSGLLKQTLYTLGLLKAREAVPYIVGMFKEKYVENTDVQQEAFDALAAIGEPVDLKLFLPYVKVGPPHHESLEQLLSMLETLGGPSDKEVISALEKFKKTLGNPMQKERVQRAIDTMKNR